MAKIRVYHDKDGQIRETEHRVAEDYDDHNASHKELKWIVVESEQFDDKGFEEFVVEEGKLVKKR